MKRYDVRYKVIDGDTLKTAHEIVNEDCLDSHKSRALSHTFVATPIDSTFKTIYIQGRQEPVTILM